MEAETKKIIRVEEEDEIEGKIAESNDYIFDKIGDPVPLKPEGFTFDPQSSPSRPLAVSDKHGLLFAAHSSGIFVAKTKDVMAAAIEIKEDKGSSSVSSIEKVSVADVPLADLHILALSTDNSTLAAATAHSDVHFFSVASLMEKGLEPSFSISIDESTSIKDMQWTKNSENMYVLLSNLGKLYRGTIGGPLTDVMDDVDAVEWSSKGSLIAVARKDILNILSSKFSQRSSIQLSFKSWIDDSDTHCIMKVDSIKWVRRDSIILGCFQLTAERTEENYVVQVIQIKDGKFTDDSCKPVVIYFNELFSYLVDDIFPPASGPYLLLSYLEECKLAIIGNRKNADQHVVYLSWSLGEERNEVVTVDIPRDNLKPRIELQDNGDDNVIMGFCVDKVSMSENISVKLEMGHKEFSPYCILIFLTLDGKLVMYHVASVSDITFAPASVSTVSDEEDDDTALVPLETEPSKFSSQLGKQLFEKVDMDVPLGDENIKELVRKVGPDVITKDDLKPLGANVVPNQMLDKGSTKSNEKVVPPTIAESFRGQQEDLFTKVYPDRNVKQVQLSGQENRNMQHRSTEASTCEMEPAGLQSSGKITPSKGDFTVSDEEDDYTALVSLETDPSKFSTQLGKQPFENFDLDVPLGDENIKGLVRKVGPDVITKDDLNSLDANVVPNQMLDKGSTKGCTIPWNWTNPPDPLTMNVMEILRQLAQKSKLAKEAIVKEPVVTVASPETKGVMATSVPEKKKLSPEDPVSGEEEEMARHGVIKAKLAHQLPLGPVPPHKPKHMEKGLGRALETATPLHEDFLHSVANGVHHPALAQIKVKTQMGDKTKDELLDSNFQSMLKALFETYTNNKELKRGHLDRVRSLEDQLEEAKREVKAAEDRARKYEVGFSWACHLEQQINQMDHDLRQLKGRESELLAKKIVWEREREQLWENVASVAGMVKDVRAAGMAAGVAEFKASDEFKRILQERFVAGVSETYAALEAQGALNVDLLAAGGKGAMEKVPEERTVEVDTEITPDEDTEVAPDEDMDEEAPDTSSTAELSLGSLSAFGLGELFHPASFNFQSLQPSQSSQPANSGFAGGFGTSMNAQAPTPSGFGQPTQVGPGQQALGSVLGAFGQLRQIGTGLPGTGFGSPSGFGGGVAGTNSPGGFSGAATRGFAGATSTVGGFAAVASGSGGFASLASGGGGFGGAASGGGGFGGAGGGFAGAAPTATGFPGANVAGAFGGQQQAPGGFSAFGSGGATGKPSQFTQMRK